MKTMQKVDENEYLVRAVQECLDQLAIHLLKRNIEIATYTQTSLNIFSHLELNKQYSILENIKKYLNVINKSEGKENLTKEEEIKCIKDALRFN